MTRLELCGHWLDILEGRESNDPEDRGGFTKRGHIQEDADSFCDRKMVPRKSIGEFTDEEIDELRLLLYWTPLGCHLMPQPVDWLLFQWGLLQFGSAAMGIQRVVGVVVDGNPGPKTAEAVRACGEMSVSTMLLEAQVDSCRRVVERSNVRLAEWMKKNGLATLLKSDGKRLTRVERPDLPRDQRAFALGWVNRTEKAAKLCELTWDPAASELAWASKQGADYKAGTFPA